MEIRLAMTLVEVEACFPAMSQLRPHLSKAQFIEVVSRISAAHNYALAYLRDSEIKSVAGFRISEWLHTGKYLDIDDLISIEGQRSKGYGSQLFDWLCKFAVDNGCKQVRLVSGVQRESAHRFYLRKGMRFEAKYFSLDV